MKPLSQSKKAYSPPTPSVQPLRVSLTVGNTAAGPWRVKSVRSQAPPPFTYSRNRSQAYPVRSVKDAKDFVFDWSVNRGNTVLALLLLALDQSQSPCTPSTQRATW